MRRGPVHASCGIFEVQLATTPQLPQLVGV